MSRVCDCGQGYRSAYDGKCGHCRSAAERSRHWWMIHKPKEARDESGTDRRYNVTRRLVGDE